MKALLVAMILTLSLSAVTVMAGDFGSTESVSDWDLEQAIGDGE